ncbi:ATP-binding protein [Galbitalea sp. SE-J8]|nr:ATP-binding protein [Galbitalea sp. SE-J8]MDM4763762.1 ATP-binding protein [Galbitalea sp. SE-J8]
MQSAWLVPLALAVGALLGASLVVVTVMAARRGQQAADVAGYGVPEGVEAVVDVLDSAGVVLDPSNNVVSASRGAYALGIVAGDHLVHTEIVDLVDAVRRSGDTLTDDLLLARSPFSDPSLHLKVRVALLGVRHVLVLAEDRTEAFRLEDVRRDFIANISHELKTPIGAIGLLAEALSESVDDPVAVARFARRMSVEADRLARITKAIIELSRLQAAEALADPDVVRVDDVVGLAIDENQVGADGRRITIVGGGQKGLEVLGDSALLVVAVHNLIANAVQYSPDGSRVGVGVRRVDDAVEIAVTDQGVGIPEEERERVFERFYRVDPARSRNTGGTGLGLAIVKHVAQNHGGDVRLWSQPGRGSTFTIRLPEATASAAASLGA